MVSFSLIFAIILVHLVGKYEDRVFDDRELTFSVNETPNDEVIEGIQVALLHFNKGETSRYSGHYENI